MNQNLLNNFLLGVPMMVACLLLQALLISTAMNFYRRKDGELVSRSFWALFRLLGEFQQYGDAFYHSAVNFATLGYGDIVMSPRHRLLGPLEAINGALMIGASTATLILAFQDSMQKTSQSGQARRG
jgi:hypothetical protein